MFSARIFGYFCTRVPVGYLNGYPVFRVVRLQHTSPRPSGVVAWGKDNDPLPPLQKFILSKNFPVIRKLPYLKEEYLLFTEQ